MSIQNKDKEQTQIYVETQYRGKNYGVGVFLLFLMKIIIQEGKTL